MKFAHARDNGLTRFLVGIRFEGGVFFGELYESHGHLFLSRFGFGFNRKLDNGVGESHLLKHYGVLFVAERVARSRIFKTDYGADIARIYFGDFGTGVCVHLYETAYPFLFALSGVVAVRAGFENARICSEICKTAYEGVGCDFERKTCEGSVVRRFSLFFSTRIGVYALDVSYVYGGRKVVYNRVQKHLNALVLIGRTAENGGAFHGYGSLS